MRWREWAPEDVLTHLVEPGRRSIRVTVELKLTGARLARWNAVLDIDLLRCTEETLTVDGDDILTLRADESMRVANNLMHTEHFLRVPFEFKGSVLSTLRLEGYHDSGAFLNQRPQRVVDYATRRAVSFSLLLVFCTPDSCL